MDNQQLWGRIKTLSTQHNVSLRQLAKDAGVPVSTLFNIQTNRSKNPSFFTIAKIADALGVSLDEFRK